MRAKEDEEKRMQKTARRKEDKGDEDVWVKVKVMEVKMEVDDAKRKRRGRNEYRRGKQEGRKWRKRRREGEKGDEDD